MVQKNLGVWISRGSIMVIGMTGLRVVSLVGLWGRPRTTLGIRRASGGLLPPYKTAETSSLFFFGNPEDPGDADTRAIFPDFKPSLIVSPILTISANFAPTSNMILSLAPAQTLS